jgi:hypothetical protein
VRGRRLQDVSRFRPKVARHLRWEDRSRNQRRQERNSEPYVLPLCSLTFLPYLPSLPHDISRGEQRRSSQNQAAKPAQKQYTDTRTGESTLRSTGRISLTHHTSSDIRIARPNSTRDETISYLERDDDLIMDFAAKKWNSTYGKMLRSQYKKKADRDLFYEMYMGEASKRDQRAEWYEVRKAEGRCISNTMIW